MGHAKTLAAKLTALADGKTDAKTAAVITILCELCGYVEALAERLDAIERKSAKPAHL